MNDPPRPRRRVTRPSVKRADRAARFLISAGGIGTILAVAFLGVFLVWIVFPLFRGARLDERPPTPVAAGTTRPYDLAVDEYRTMCAIVSRGGEVSVVDLRTGALLDKLSLFGGKRPTAWSPPRPKGAMAAGFADGTVRVFRLRFQTRYLEDEAQLPDSVRRLKKGERVDWKEGVVERTPEGQLRALRLRPDVEAPLSLHDAPISLLDYSDLASGGFTLAVLSADGKLGVTQYEKKTNLLTGEETFRGEEVSVPFKTPGGLGRPFALRLCGVGNIFYLAWREGSVERFASGDGTRFRLAETTRLVPAGRTLTCLRFLEGKTTLVAGDDRGDVHGWFPTKPPGAGTVDGVVLRNAHTLPGPAHVPVVALAPSPRSRVLAAAYGNGALRLFYVTTDSLLGETSANGSGVEALAITPRQDGLVALTPEGLAHWRMDLGYPEAGFRSFFGKVWYEGSTKPAYVWQSSSSTSAFEPKLSMVALIFGTIKATLYSILFGAPLALLAAVFTSEFLRPRLRAPVKSTIEIMASLPSVVLGFLGALVIAPFVQNSLAAVVGAFFLIPLVFLLGAQLWQLLPESVAVRLEGTPRMLAMAATIPVAVFLASLTGPRMERWLFGGDLKGWLFGNQPGKDWPGWFLLLIPLAAVGVFFLFREISPALVRRPARRRGRAALGSLFRFLTGLVFTFVLAYLFARLLGSVLHWDLRGSFIGPYVQRNALIVAFVMGFAIIPIIYTLAEDALSSVPRHLREASLGAGATPWQTAVRIVIPTAMSGLFSALMIGLGRAVGETMIVLMVTGNTPILDWNVFNGFRALSANIAVEMPEAARNTTLYRTLFVAALVLFVMTFLVNTVAEAVRQHFRKRAFEL